MPPPPKPRLLLYQSPSRKATWQECFEIRLLQGIVGRFTGEEVVGREVMGELVDLMMACPSCMPEHKVHVASVQNHAVTWPLRGWQLREEEAEEDEKLNVYHVWKFVTICMQWSLIHSCWIRCESYSTCLMVVRDTTTLPATHWEQLGCNWEAVTDSSHTLHQLLPPSSRLSRSSLKLARS